MGLMGDVLADWAGFIPSAGLLSAGLFGQEKHAVVVIASFS